ncbi:Protein kinase superfamily protein [Zea mays]|uniref:Protein kinase superfamily protein n=1 Tax=Zea mays TaxID=4577 RepID=A0A1D6N480_MAIZE|nr:Protein kinase superfamily protein [Zea mays]
MPLALAQLQDLRDRISDRLRPWSRSAQFWVRAADIYTSYKVCQLRAGFVKDEDEREAMWEQQHELGAQKMYSLCSELGGLFLKVHRARLKLSNTDVAVKVQHPGAEHLMMVDIRNMQAMALFLQKYDINFDLFSATKEMEKQICYEFDFVREASAMERIREFLRITNKKPPVMVPRVIPGMVTREVLVMEFIKGTPIMNLGNEMARRGIDPSGKIAAMAKQMAFSMQIHTQETSLSVALLDYGQVKEMPEDLRLAYANLVVAMADDDFLRAEESFRELGIRTWAISDNKLEELFQLSLRMFDTRLPPGVTVMSPFADDSSLTKIGVELQNQESKREVFSGDCFGEVGIGAIKEHDIRTFCDESMKRN